MKFQKKTKQNVDKQPIRCRVQKAGYQDAQGTHWILQKHKKDLGRNEDYMK